MPKKQIYFMVEAALIATAYIGLTFISNLLNLAYGPIQFRISEVLAVLPIFIPSAIWGLAIGCFFSNIVSLLGPIDMLFGTMATVIAALLTYALRKITVKDIPYLSLLSPVIVNSLIIGLEINLFYLADGLSFWGYLLSAFSVGIGEAVICFLLGIPLILTVKRYGFFSDNKF